MWYSYFAEASVFHALIAARPLCVCPSSFTMAFSVKHCETASPSPLSAVKYAAMGFGRLGGLVAFFIFVSFLLGVFALLSQTVGMVPPSMTTSVPLI